MIAPANARSISLRLVALLSLLIFVALSAPRMDLSRIVAIASAGHSAGGAGAQAGLRGFWPPQVETRAAVADPSDLDPARLPPFARIETQTIRERQLDPETLLPVVREVRRTWLVSPFGYLVEVAVRMLETIEIALWGTLLAVLAGFPIALLRARAFGLPRPVRMLARMACAGLRALPELLVALILVGLLGFGPPAGIVALGIHAAGFIGRFHADAFDDADQRPVEALWASGAGRLAVFRIALLPQVRAGLASSTLYILDRNVRMATVIGIVGAGGIGQELKGRIDMYDYGHAATIVLAIFAVVALLDEFAAHLRRRQSS